MSEINFYNEGSIIDPNNIDPPTNKESYLLHFDLSFWNKHERDSRENLLGNLEAAKGKFARNLILYSKENSDENEREIIEFNYFNSILELGLAYHAFNPISPKLFRKFKNTKKSNSFTEITN